jgi:diguanylate cyclase (GGDEF)-like protein
MQLDSATLQIMCGLLVVLCGVSFIFNTALNRNDPPGRLWSLSFVGGIMVTTAYAVYLLSADAWWTIAVGNAALVFCVGSLWAGSRVYNGRNSGFLLVAGLAFVITVISFLPGASGGEWAGAGPLWLVVALLGGRNVNGRILSLVLLIVTGFYTLRAVAFIVQGPDSAVFNAYFDSDTTSVLNMSLIVTASIAVSILRAEGAGSNAVGDITVGIHSAAGVLSATSFQQAAADHLERAERAELGLAVIGADIDNLPEINTAFGRVAGDEAIARFADTLRSSAPLMAQIGHPAAGRFYVLAAVGSATEARTITERIQNALVDGPLGESYRIRLTASFGIADTFDHGYALDGLTAAVGHAIGVVKAQGGNDIAVATETVTPL